MSEVLITGATGFLGYYLTHALAAEGHSFRALVRPGADTRYLSELGDRCTLIEGDILDPDSVLAALTGVDTVIHAAAAVSFLPSDRLPMLRTNVEGTANVVNMMLQAGCRRLLYVSSVAALNRVSGGPIVTVADRQPTHPPVSDYARSKQLAEREAWRGRAEGLSVAAVYPSVMLGAGDWSGHNAPALWRQAAGGMAFYPAGGSGFVDVRDVARALLLLHDRDLDGERWLLNDTNLSWRALMTAIAQSIGAPPPRWLLPAWVVRIVAPVLEGIARLRERRPLITRESARKVQSTYAYDGTPFAEVSGRRYLDIGETVREVGAAYRMAKQMGDGSIPIAHLPVK